MNIYICSRVNIQTLFNGIYIFVQHYTPQAVTQFTQIPNELVHVDASVMSFPWDTRWVFGSKINWPTLCAAPEHLTLASCERWQDERASWRVVADRRVGTHIKRLNILLFHTVTAFALFSCKLTFPGLVCSTYTPPHCREVAASHLVTCATCCCCWQPSQNLALTAWNGGSMWTHVTGIQYYSLGCLWFHSCETVFSANNIKPICDIVKWKNRTA